MKSTCLYMHYRSTSKEGHYLGKCTPHELCNFLILLWCSHSELAVLNQENSLGREDNSRGQGDQQDDFRRIIGQVESVAWPLCPTSQCCDQLTGCHCNSHWKQRLLVEVEELELIANVSLVVASLYQSLSTHPILWTSSVQSEDTTMGSF